MNGLDVMVYFWDDRDGASFGGWWFGPKIGGDQVWCYHADKSAQTPPLSGWKVPYDGPLDPTFLLTPAGAKLAVGAASPYSPAQQARMQWEQQQLQQKQNRDEEQKKKMEDMKKQQEELANKRKEEIKKKAEEAEKNRKELLAVGAIRKVFAKLKAVNLDTVEAVKTELSEVMAKELEACGSQKDAIQKEHEAALKQSEEKVKTMEEQKVKRAEAGVVRVERVKELNKLIETAEAANADAKSKADAVAEPTGEPTVAQIEKAVASAEEALTVAKEKTKACSTFLLEKNAELKDIFRTAGETVPEAEKDLPNFKMLTSQLYELNSSVSVSSKTTTTGKVKGVKKATAVEERKKATAVVKAFDKDKDGLLNKKEFLAYSKGAFKFDFPAAIADAVVDLLSDGKKGISVEATHRLKIAIGIQREQVRDAKRKAQRLVKETELGDKKEKLKARVEAAVKVVDAAEAATKAFELVAAPLFIKTKAIASTEMAAAADEADALIKTATSAMEEASKAVEVLKAEEDADIAGMSKMEATKQQGRVTGFEKRIAKLTATVDKVRGGATRKGIEELESLCKRAKEQVRNFQSKEKLTTDVVYAKFGSGDSVDEKKFIAFFTSYAKEVEVKEGAEVKPLEAAELSRVFKSLDEANEGKIAKDDILSFMRCYYKVVKETVITDTIDIKAGNVVRRLALDEICVVVEGPVKDEGVEVMRVRIKALQDGAEGWVTPVGNQGTPFLIGGGELNMKVLKETILTPSIELGADMKTLRKLKAGEVVEVCEWMKKESSGLERMKVRAKDGKVGWATAVGTAGAKFLEVV